MVHLMSLLQEYSHSDSTDTMPDWMHSLQKTLMDPSIHRNVVLFIVRLILNLQSAFQPYAKLWSALL